MSKDDKKPAFDPSRFAMQSTGAEEFGTRKIRSVISVNKPGKMEWVRLFDHVDYLIPGAALLDLQDGGRMYLVVPEIAAQLEDDVRLYTLAPALTRQDKLFLWPQEQLILSGKGWCKSVEPYIILELRRDLWYDKIHPSAIL